MFTTENLAPSQISDPFSDLKKNCQNVYVGASKLDKSYNTLVQITDIGEDCTCNPGFTGNPFQGCTLQNPCTPSPCGPNTECAENRAGQVVCSCR